jgi:hypothetical protein
MHHNPVDTYSSLSKLITGADAMKRTHNAGVEGSSPSLSTNQISVIPRQGEFASLP